MAYRILIVDDEPILTELLSTHLQDHGYAVSVANSSDEALAKLNTKPNLILLDINMPGMDGLELCKVIRNHIVCPILFLTARITEQDKVNGLRAGGDDYITKPFGLQELLARIEAHLRRERREKQLQRKVFGDMTIDYSAREITVRGEQIRFNRKEYEIIRLLSLNRGQTFEREKIYDRVWGLEGSGDDAVIMEHIRKIRQKFAAAGCGPCIETVWGIGYKWIG